MFVYEVILTFSKGFKHAYSMAEFYLHYLHSNYNGTNSCGKTEELHLTAAPSLCTIITGIKDKRGLLDYLFYLIGNRRIAHYRTIFQYLAHFKYPRWRYYCLWPWAFIWQYDRMSIFILHPASTSFFVLISSRRTRIKVAGSPVSRWLILLVSKEIKGREQIPVNCDPSDSNFLQAMHVVLGKYHLGMYRLEPPLPWFLLFSNWPIWTAQKALAWVGPDVVDQVQFKIYIMFCLFLSFIAWLSSIMILIAQYIWFQAVRPRCASFQQSGYFMCLWPCTVYTDHTLLWFWGPPSNMKGRSSMRAW